MLDSILYQSTDNRNDSFKGSKIICGSWASIVLGALNDSGYHREDIDILKNNRVLKGCKHSEIVYYKGNRVMTLRTDRSMSANDVVKVFNKICKCK